MPVFRPFVYAPRRGVLHVAEIRGRTRRAAVQDAMCRVWWCGVYVALLCVVCYSAESCAKGRYAQSPEVARRAARALRGCQVRAEEMSPINNRHPRTRLSSPDDVHAMHEAAAGR